MDYVTLFGMASALAMDAFAVSAVVASGLDRLTLRHTFRLAWHFGFFQAAMPVLGWLGGSALSSVVVTITHWVAFGLLTFIGIRMVWGSLAAQGATAAYDPTRGWSLVGLSLATSIDALAAGLSLGLIGLSVWVPALVIGIVTIALTTLGASIGRRAGALIGPWAERTGGMLLIAIGARILIQHL